jgi:hypothetical protein
VGSVWDCILLMTGDDLLDSPTGTTVEQRSESGQGILGGKEGKGMWVWSSVVLTVLSSNMSADIHDDVTMGT